MLYSHYLASVARFSRNLSQYGRLSPAFGRVQLHGGREILHHSTIIDLLLLLKLIKESNPSLIVQLRCWEVIINDVSGVALKLAM